MRALRRKLTRRQAEIAMRFGENVTKSNETATVADHVKQIPMLAGCRIGPFAGGALACTGSTQPNKHRPARGVASVSDDPVVANASAVGEIVAADVLGLLCKPAGEIRYLDLHGQSLKGRRP